VFRKFNIYSFYLKQHLKEKKKDYLLSTRWTFHNGEFRSINTNILIPLFFYYYLTLLIIYFLLKKI